VASFPRGTAAAPPPAQIARKGKRIDVVVEFGLDGKRAISSSSQQQQQQQQHDAEKRPLSLDGSRKREGKRYDGS